MTQLIATTVLKHYNAKHKTIEDKQFDEQVHHIINDVWYNIYNADPVTGHFTIELKIKVHYNEKDQAHMHPLKKALLKAALYSPSHFPFKQQAINDAQSVGHIGFNVQGHPNVVHEGKCLVYTTWLTAEQVKAWNNLK